MAEAIGPGTPLVCIAWRWPFTPVPTAFSHASLTVDAIYRCEKVGGADEEEGFAVNCPWDGCGTVWIGVSGKACACCGNLIPYCPNLFRPLNDGDTSLVENEKEIVTGPLVHLIEGEYVE